MKTYVILMRGINVGGKNKIAMPALKQCLEEEGFTDVRTLMQSGNAVLRSNLNAKATAEKIESALPRAFKLDRSIIKVVALEAKTFKSVVTEAPKEFGEDNANHRYYVLFPMEGTAARAMKEIEARPGIDTAWQGRAAIYYRLPSLTNRDRSKSWLNRVTQKPLYQVLTMRNWATTTKLLAMVEDSANQKE
jgi:uncharacterized protein (DUF1697 family)